MLFWDVGATIWIFRYVFKDPGVDTRALILGALLPNLIDKPIALLIAPAAFDTTRIYGHTLLAALVVLTLSVLLTRRSTLQRKRAVALSVGMLIHLLTDAMWTVPETLFWPAFGFDFPPAAADTLTGLFRQFASDPIAIGLELIGLAYLAYLWRRAGLSDRSRRAAFLHSGRLDIAT